MAYFKLTNFSGIAPALSARLLADKVGQIAENIDFESGRLVSTTENSVEAEDELTTATRRSIYKYEYDNTGTPAYKWLQWSKDVDVVEGPVADDELDRLYWTEEGEYPQIGFGTGITGGNAPYPSTSWRLGVPMPSVPMTAVVTGQDPSGATPNEYVYAFTLVTNDGREGPPSELTSRITALPLQTITLTMPSLSSLSLDDQDNISVAGGAKMFIYRSNVGSSATALQYMTAKNIDDTTSFVDNFSNDSLEEVIPSETWVGPPDGNAYAYPDGPMQGLIAIAQGMMAGFAGKRFCVSEPFLPHAWPIGYRITLDDDVVGIAGTANGVVALTKRRPYFITGTSPSAMASATVELSQACLSKHSIVDMGDYVLYAGPDGLCSVQGTTGKIVTRGQISAEQWKSDFYPDKIRAFKHKGTYVAFWENGGEKGGWVYDPRSTDKSLSTLTTTTEIRGGHYEPDTGELFLIIGNDISKYRGSSAPETLKFKTKKFVTPKPVSMGWVGIDANEYPVTVKVWADDTLISEYVVSETSGGGFTVVTNTPSNIATRTDVQETIMRLPPVIGQEWEIQVEGTDINEICIAQSQEELRRA